MIGAFEIVVFLCVFGSAVVAVWRRRTTRQEAVDAARRALAANSRRAIEDVLITYKLPRKMRRQLQKRSIEMLGDELVNDPTAGNP